MELDQDRDEESEGADGAARKSTMASESSSASPALSGARQIKLKLS